MKSRLKLSLLLAIGFTFGIASMSAPSFAADEGLSNDNSSKLPIDKVKERYWGKGRETELRVVQHRLYSKSESFEAEVFGGVISTDPFLNVKNYGFGIGYNFNDFFAVRGLYWKDSVSNSTALTTIQTQNNTTANTNIPNHFFGGEFDYTPLYGKLSLVGKAIVYFDTHIDAGLGWTSTQTGSDLSEYIGVGEEFYLTRWATFRIDYRLLRYSEDLPQKTIGSDTPGPIVGSRTNWNDVITLGFTFYGNPF